MLNFINKLFGGSKSEKDVKKLAPVIDQINQHFNSYQSISNDELRGKTTDFRNRIKEYTKEIADKIAAKKEEAENTVDIHVKNDIFKEIKTKTSN
jgi:preprotein translocase subunit SecA